MCRRDTGDAGVSPGHLTSHRPDGVAEGIAQDPFLLVVQDKHTVHGELLGAGQGWPGIIMDTLLEGDGLTPLVNMGV